MANDGKAYEALTEQIFDRLLKQSSICATVERDVIVEGRATKHQIDVTFEFVAGPMKYRTIVQCKDWASPVKQEQVLAFHSVLADIPGQPRGIMVSRSGFQEGARNVAKHHGIELYELRAPQDEDWNGLLRTVVVQMHIRAPHFHNVRAILDEAAIREELLTRGQSEFSLNYSGPPPPFFLESGEACDLNSLLTKLAPKTGRGPVHVRHEFAERIFAEYPECAIPRVAIQAVEADITVDEINREIRVNIDHLIAYAFRDALTGAVRFVQTNGVIRDA